MQSLSLKYIARTYSLYVGYPEAQALVQVVELVARYKTINYVIMSAQDCWYYDGSCTEPGRKNYVVIKKLQYAQSVSQNSCESISQ